MRRECDEVDVDREQHQFDRHQDNDDVLPIQKNAKNAQRKKDRADGAVMSKADF